MRTVLVVSISENDFPCIADALKKNFRLEQASSIDGALKLVRARQHDIVYLDLEILLASASEKQPEVVLGEIHRLHPLAHIILVCPSEKIRQAVGFLKAGADNYVTRPLHTDEIQLVAESANQELLKNLELDYLRDQFWRSEALDLVRTENTATKKVFEKIRSVARTKATVLLVGETGTGKGVIARLIHMHSNRSEAQFISVHCGAIPDTLLESELFGHEKGAFTGAVRRKLGKFEIARGGTIFLDEVGTVSPSSQIKLLQVLQDGIFSRVGGEEVIETDARIIAATNADLKAMSEEGSFRRDLYYRLNVFPIELPPLRQRREDIPFFIQAFLQRLNRIHGKPIDSVHPLVIDTLGRYGWPGNIRELENLMERAYILETTGVLNPESFPEELFQDSGDATVLPMRSDCSLAEARKKAIEDFERQYLKDLFSRNHGKVKKSAEQAGITTRQLNKLMLKYGIRKEEFKE
ncbi:MAG TPA: sigma 54-interacting transcriptional regulator [Desulfobacterales bacterium]